MTGRPTIYNEEILTQARGYLLHCTDTEANKELGITAKVSLPSIEGLAKYLHINRDTLYDWAKTYQEFSDILEQIRVEQADKLINNGLAGTYNSTIAKLILTKHGYTDRADVTSDNKPLKGNSIVFSNFKDEAEG